MSEENYNQQEAAIKLKQMVDSIDICLFCTAINNGQVHAVPMSRQEVNESGTVWFLANAESDTCKNIVQNNRVALHFADKGNYEFLVASGTASLSRDQARIDKYWNQFMEAWFEKGKDDPSIRIIEIKVEDANYWETKNGKMITFFKIAASALTGKQFDTGVEGSLEL